MSEVAAKAGEGENASIVECSAAPRVRLFVRNTCVRFECSTLRDVMVADKAIVRPCQTYQD